MNQAQVTEIAKIATDAAINFLAEKHNVQAHNIVDALAAGNLKISAQFFKLVETGLRESILFVAAHSK